MIGNRDVGMEKLRKRNVNRYDGGEIEPKKTIDTQPTALKLVMIYRKTNTDAQNYSAARSERKSGT